MARRKNPPVQLPTSTRVELVGTKVGKPTAKTEMNLDDAIKKKKQLENDPKWRGWYFQIYQLGFSSHKNTPTKNGN